jgi:RNA polymerase sigma-70 factor (ECF subfamily)
LDDKKIIELFYERSEQAITELSKKYGLLCEKIADNILNNHLDAEECVNDAYLAVWNTIPPQNPDSLVSYVCRIVRNQAIKKYHENTALKRNSIYDTSLDELEEVLPSSASVEGELEAKEVSAIIDRFLETLDKQSRTMFIRRYWYSDSIEEIALSFKTSKHYISVRLSRIRKALKKYLVKEGVSV